MSGDPREVTEYKQLFLTVILWRLATVNSNTRIVVILFLSSQWDTMWQKYMIWLGWVLWHINHCRLFNAKSSLYIYILNIYDLLGLGWVLWHIKHCRLFNTKSSLYIYIKYILFGWVVFYGISTIVGYLMPNPLYTYISNIYYLVGLCFMAYQPL